MKKLITILLILFASIISFGQDKIKWTKIFENKNKHFYIGAVENKKEFYLFLGKIEEGNSVIISGFIMYCSEKRAFIFADTKDDKIYLFDKPIEIPIEKKTAINAAYENICGVEI